MYEDNVTPLPQPVIGTPPDNSRRRIISIVAIAAVAIVVLISLYLFVLKPLQPADLEGSLGKIDEIAQQYDGIMSEYNGVIGLEPRFDSTGRIFATQFMDDDFSGLNPLTDKINEYNNSVSNLKKNISGVSDSEQKIAEAMQVAEENMQQMSSNVELVKKVSAAFYIGTPVKTMLSYEGSPSKYTQNETAKSLLSDGDESIKKLASAYVDANTTAGIYTNLYSETESAYDNNRCYDIEHSSSEICRNITAQLASARSEAMELLILAESELGSILSKVQNINNPWSLLLSEFGYETTAN